MYAWVLAPTSFDVSACANNGDFLLSLTVVCFNQFMDDVWNLYWSCMEVDGFMNAGCTL